MSAEFMTSSKKPVLVSKEAWKRSNQEAKQKGVKQSEVLSWIIESYLEAVPAESLPAVLAGLEKRGLLDWRKGFTINEAAKRLKNAAKEARVSEDETIRAAMGWYLQSPAAR